MEATIDKLRQSQAETRSVLVGAPASASNTFLIADEEMANVFILKSSTTFVRAHQFFIIHSFEVEWDVIDGNGFLDNRSELRRNEMLASRKW